MVKDYKEKPDRPFQEIPVSFVPDYDEENGNRNSLEKRQFREEDGVHHQSEERKEDREKEKKNASKWAKIIIKRLNKDWEKRLFNLVFCPSKEKRFKIGIKGENKVHLTKISEEPIKLDYYEIGKKMKMTEDQIHQKVRILTEKIPKICQTYLLFQELKEKFQKILTSKQYRCFELFYDKWMTILIIAEKNGIKTRTVEDRIKRGKERILKLFGKGDLGRFNELKRKRFSTW